MFDQEIEEKLEEPILDSQSKIYSNDQFVFEFEKRPNAGKDKHFDSILITNYIVLTVRSKENDEVIFGKIIMPKQMERMIKEKGLVEVL